MKVCFIVCGLYNRTIFTASALVGRLTNQTTAQGVIVSGCFLGLAVNSALTYCCTPTMCSCAPAMITSRGCQSLLKWTSPIISSIYTRDTGAPCNVNTINISCYVPEGVTKAALTQPIASPILQYEAPYCFLFPFFLSCMHYSAFVTFDSRPTTVHTISIPPSDSNILPLHHQQQIAPYNLHTVVLPPSAPNTPSTPNLASVSLSTKELMYNQQQGADVAPVSKQ